MTSQEPRLIPLAGFFLRLVPTAKFKTTFVQFRFSAPFPETDPEPPGAFALCSARRHVECSTKRQFLDRCDRLYGAQIGASVAKQGMMSVVSFSLSVVNEAFLPGEASVFQDALDLFREVVFSPRLYRGCFRKGVVTDEIRLLREDLEADYADKAEYSFQRMTEHMFKDELARYRPKGDEATLDEVTPSALLSAYRDMLEHDIVECSVVGAVDGEAVVEAIRRRFAFAPRTIDPEWIDTRTKAIDAPAYVTEYNDVSQARLQLGYRVAVRAGSKDYLSMLVANAMFGDSDTSKLFQTVRERDHLCYYVYSAYAAAKGAVFVSAGVDPDRAGRRAPPSSKRCARTSPKARFPTPISTSPRWPSSSGCARRPTRSAGSSPTTSISIRLFQRAYVLSDNIALVNALTKEEVRARFAEFVLDTVYELTRRDA
ncbi:MAG: insulinase family protein [Bacillus subtilis]|nr:insulinase family protein [Bacillus subtilis]